MMKTYIAYLARTRPHPRALWFLFVPLLLQLSLMRQDVGPLIPLKTFPGGLGYSSTAAIGDYLYVAADDGAHQGQVWRSDGTAAGTTLVVTTNPTGSSPPPFALTNVSGRLMFAGHNDEHGFELWAADSTGASASLLVDINPGAASGLDICFANRCTYSQFLALGQVLFFTGTDGQHGFELWKSDGTVAGTMQVKDINPGSDGSFPSELTGVNGVLFFTARDAVKDQPALWKSDGTPGGTVRVAEIPATNLTNVHNALLFSTSDDQFGDVLWKSDGTTDGTQQIAPVWASQITDVNGVFFFESVVKQDNQGWNFQLWKSDGTRQGTVLVADINPNAVGDTEISQLTVVNGLLFFIAIDESYDTELWKSNGTTTGTLRVTDNPPAPGGSASYTGGLFGSGVMAFFTASDGIHGYELWSSDGSAAKTGMVQDIAPNEQSSYPEVLGIAGENLFVAADDAHNVTLWAMPRPVLKTFLPLLSQ